MISDKMCDSVNANLIDYSSVINSKQRDKVVDNSKILIQNYIVEQLEDGNLQLILCNTQGPNSNCEKAAQQSLLKVNNPRKQISSVPTAKDQPNDVNNTSRGEENECQESLDSGKYVCIQCKEEFNNLLPFMKHTIGHKQLKKFNCVKCEAGFNIENNLKVHMITSHLPTTDVCPICRIKFQRRASLKSHILVHQVEELFICEECQAEFESDAELIKHLEIHARSNISGPNNDSLICPYCKLDFNTLTEYKDHISLHIQIKKNVLRGKKTRKRRLVSKFGYKCKACGKMFAKGCLLLRHERIHTGERPFICPFCNRGFAQKGTLQIHISHHTGVKPYSCTLCSAKFNQKGNLRVHIEKTHTAPKGNEKVYKCSQCTCIFKKIATLNGHVTKVHINQAPVGTPNEEDFVKEVTNNLKILESEMTNSSQSRTLSRSVESSTIDNFKQIDEAEVREPLGYVRLSESLVNGNIRRYLVKQKKIGDIRWYFCNYCLKKFKKPSDLIRHIRVHTQEKPFKCSKCDSNFTLKSTLISHLKTHTVSDKDCPHCDSSFKNPKCFDVHIRKHEEKNVPNYICLLCERLFLTYEEGRQHRAEHVNQISSTENIIEPYLKQPLFQTAYGSLALKPPKQKIPNTGTESEGERPHHCVLCDARFSRLLGLKRHLQYHTGERQYKCHLCPKAFITSYRLNEHLSYHKGVKNYGCEICGKKFVTLSLLKRHIIIHNTYRPYVCPYCNKTFKTLLICRTHIRNIHKLSDVRVIKREPILKEEIDSGSTVNQTVTPCRVEIDKVQAETDKVEVPISSKDVSHFGDLPPPPAYNSGNQAPVNSNPLFLNVALDEVEGSNYQVVYLNLAEVQEPILPSGGANANTKLQNDTIVFNSLDDLRQSTMLFNIDNKSDMVDPNEVIKSSLFLHPPDTQPEISDKSQIANGTIASDIILDHLTPLGLETAIGGQVLNSTSTLCASKELFNAQVMCIHCHKIYSDMEIFQKHDCGSISKVVTSQNNQLDPNLTKTDSIKDVDGSKVEIQSAEEAPEVKQTIKDKRKRIKINHHNKRSPYRKDKKGEKAKVLTCNLCMDIFMSEVLYKKHMISIHGEGKTCKFCLKEFTKPSDLKRHLRTHTGEKPFQCDQCEKRFSLKSTLDSHKKTHVNVQRSISCDVCNSAFSSKSGLKVHMLLHTGERPYSCSFCKQAFRTSAIKKAHERVHHLRQNVPSNKPKTTIKLLKTVAEDIANNFNSEQDCINEVQPATDNEIPNEQIIVDKVNNPPDSVMLQTLNVDQLILLQQLQNANLILTTDSDSAVPLNISDITLLNGLSPTIQQLEVTEPVLEQNKDTKDHKKKQVQKVMCDICCKIYASKDVLRKHKKKVHGQNKKFPCIKCDKSYDSLDELNHHIKMHTGYRPFLCQYCPNSFSEAHNLKTHVKRIHQKSVISQETTNALLNLQYDLSTLSTATDSLI